jgi:hypothetical protein
MNCKSCTNESLCEALCFPGNMDRYRRKWSLKLADKFFANWQRYRRWVGGEWIKFYLEQPVGPPTGSRWRERPEGGFLPSNLVCLQREYWWPAHRPENKWEDPDQ